jgi:hypothetical protein
LYGAEILQFAVGQPGSTLDNRLLGGVAPWPKIPALGAEDTGFPTPSPMIPALVVDDTGG